MLLFRQCNKCRGCKFYSCMLIPLWLALNAFIASIIPALLLIKTLINQHRGGQKL